VVNGILILFGSLLFSIADVLKRSAPHYLFMRWSVGLTLKTYAKEAGFVEDWGS